MANWLNTPFEKWAQAEGVPIVRGYFVPDAYEVTLKPWRRTGGLGAIVILEGGQGFSNAFICEIPPGTSLKPQRHLFEERTYILQGQGETKFWNDGGSVHRYSSQQNYFDGKGKMVDKTTWKGGFITDIRKPYLGETTEYGKGYGVLSLELSENGMGAHLAQIEVGTYKKPHRHGAGAHLIIIEGTGYALMWQDWDKKVRADFKKGTIYCPPEGWWHTHCNTGTQVVRQVALRCGIPGIGKNYQQRLGIKKGGDMLEREDEPPAVRKLFEEELAKKGLKSAMS